MGDLKPIVEWAIENKKLDMTRFEPVRYLTDTKLIIDITNLKNFCENYFIHFSNRVSGRNSEV